MVQPEKDKIMANKNCCRLSLVAGVALATGMAVALPGNADAGGNPFVAQELTGGYQLANKDGEGRCGEGKCGENKTTEEGKCGEGKCGESNG